jgi:TPR repeat protein
MNLEPDQLIDNRYQIIEKLGEGGMGAVWKARHVALGDEVVVKMPLFQNDPEMLKRFGKEAQTMRKHSIECPHILNIEDIGELNETPWYVMRFLPGGSVRDRVLPRDEMGAANWDEGSFDWLIKIASALDYLHGKQAYHRDVKPENILFSKDGTPYLVDFGIVKTVNETTSMMTEQGKAVGTMAYMAPEILDGAKFTAQSDQYSLAVTLYETLTGERPFSGTTFFSLFKSIQQGHRKLTELHPVIPRAASNTVDRALSHDPAERFGSCLQFANEFISRMMNSDVPPSEAPTGMVPIEAASSLNIAFVDGQQENDKSGIKFEPSAESPSKSPVGPTAQSSWKKPTLIAAVLLAAMLAFGGLAMSGLFSSSGTPTAKPTTPDVSSIDPSGSPAPPADSLETVEDLLADASDPTSNISLGVEMLSRLASNGELAAQKRLGKIYAKGDLVERDVEESFRWFLLAAEQGDADSQMSVATSYAKGKDLGVEQDLAKANNWYRKAAEAGIGGAQLVLGSHYFEGIGVTKNFAEAKEWLQKAIDSDVIEAKSVLAEIAEAEKPRLIELTSKEYAKASRELVTRHSELFAAAQNELGSRAEKLKDYDEAIKWYRKAAEQDFASAQFKLGGMYQAGQGVEKDFSEALRWYHKAAEQGSASAQNRLGNFYLEGHVVEKDFEEALAWYRKAVAQNNASAQYGLGTMFYRGAGVEQDRREAVSWFHKSAEQGFAYAQQNLGFAYQIGDGVVQDYAEAVGWFRKAAEQGSAICQNQLGIALQNGRGVGQDHGEAVEWYRKAAEQKLAAAQSNLGVMYNKGLGVQKDQREAVNWYRKAAKQGNAFSQHELGFAYQNGLGIGQDYSEAVKWYRKAAEQGNKVSQNSLGKLYLNGLGVEKDISQALKWHRKAAEQGHARSQLSIALGYKAGQYLPKDDTQAIYWMRLAAEQGHALAEEQLGLMFERGEGTSVNYQEALRLYRSAAEKGLSTAQYAVGKMYYEAKGVAKNDEIAAKWMRKAAANGNQHAIRGLRTMGLSQ